MKAKIVYLARAVSGKHLVGTMKDLTSSIFSMMEAAEFYERINNSLGQSSCLMVLGCIFASRVEELGEESC